tara:strand:- start:15 stop:221 length:207 start_codon:yes stop_codon:yes gene_type:complete
MKYITGMKVKFENEEHTVISSCSYCKEGWEIIQKEEDLDMMQICQMCDGLVNGSTTYQFQEGDGYTIL